MVRDKDREKFKELAEKRVRRALKDIQLIGNLSNRSNYVYTDADARKIIRALTVAITEVKNRFENRGDSGPEMFTLD